MDGYAVRLDDLSQATLPVRHSPRIGQAPPELDPGCAMRIVTGGAAPAGAEAIVPRELVEEHEDRIILRIAPGEVSRGQHIRRQGENGRAGVGVLPGGTLIHAPSLAALASFGVARLTVYRKVRVGVIVTGDELLDVESRPAPWQIRDSNGPALDTLLSACPWVESRAPVRVADEEEVLRGRLREALRDCDVVVLTGAGYRWASAITCRALLRRWGARVMFHKLPIRPGKPILAAVGPDGQAILGLPGNPVSAMVGACRFLAPVCRKRGGFLQPMARPAQVQVVNPDQAALKLWWWRLVKSCGVRSGATGGKPGIGGHHRGPPGAMGSWRSRRASAGPGHGRFFVGRSD